MSDILSKQKKRVGFQTEPSELKNLKRTEISPFEKKDKKPTERFNFDMDIELLKKVDAFIKEKNISKRYLGSYAIALVLKDQGVDIDIESLDLGRK